MLIHTNNKRLLLRRGLWPTGCKYNKNIIKLYYTIESENFKYGQTNSYIFVCMVNSWRTKNDAAVLRHLPALPETFRHTDDNLCLLKYKLILESRCGLHLLRRDWITIGELCTHSYVNLTPVARTVKLLMYCKLFYHFQILTPYLESKVYFFLFN